MKISEAFQKAIDQNIPQIRGEYRDGKGGYCALGWLAEEDVDQHGFGFWLRRNYDGWVWQLNDQVNWSWSRFRDAALEYEAEKK